MANCLKALRLLCRLVVLLALAAGAYRAAAAVSVLTYHNDNARTGANTAETVLTPANVNVCSFGKLFSQPVDGQVYAQPLYVPGVEIPSRGTHNLVIVCTMHDSVYAFDADSAAGENAAPLWMRSFIVLPNITPVPVSDVGNGYGDIEREIGICSTPVIDPATNTLFVVAKTKQLVGPTATYSQRLHALDLVTGAEKYGGPVLIAASVAGIGYNGAYGTLEDVSNGVTFNALTEHQRSALLWSNGNVYIAWAAHEDKDPYHGWVISYGVDSGTQTLTQTGVYNSTPNGGRGGIWQGGAGPSADAGGAIFVATGNGSFDPQTSGYGDSYIKLTHSQGSLARADFFTPSNQADLDRYDTDLGSGGLLVLPDQPGTHPHLLVGSGKEGTVYLIDRDAMGGYAATDQVVQEIRNAHNGVWGIPAYWNGHVYFGPQGDTIKVFTLDSGKLTAGSVLTTATAFGYPGTTPAISANGTADGILWALDVSAYRGDGPAVLHAYDATAPATELYNSGQAGPRDRLGQAIKFTVPTVANGRVYVGTGTELDVLGLGVPLGLLSGAATGSAGVRVTFTCAVDPATAQDPANYSLDNGAAVTDAVLDAGGASVTLTTSALMSGVVYTVAVSNVQDHGSPPRTIAPGSTVTITPPGLSGLTGAYYANMSLSGDPVLRRTDPQIDFDWSSVSPDPAIDLTGYSVRWTGFVSAPTAGAYTFYTVTDDGVRLLVNGQTIVDAWYDQAPTEHQGTAPMAAGVKTPIEMQFYQNRGGSVARLLWSGPSTGKAPVPSSALFARPFNYGDVALALASAGGLRNVKPQPGLILSPGGAVDLPDVVRIVRKAAGLDQNP